VGIISGEGAANLNLPKAVFKRYGICPEVERIFNT